MFAPSLIETANLIMPKKEFQLVKVKKKTTLIIIKMFRTCKQFWRWVESTRYVFAGLYTCRLVSSSRGYTVENRFYDRLVLGVNYQSNFQLVRDPRSRQEVGPNL